MGNIVVLGVAVWAGHALLSGLIVSAVKGELRDEIVTKDDFVKVKGEVQGVKTQLQGIEAPLNRLEEKLE
ncbi:MAG: hypothetical protein F6K58_10530 [Symploca sp. SIO2E9]|nr:hypothetical protein [Symploca sp. SIO2E9]